MSRQNQYIDSRSTAAQFISLKEGKFATESSQFFSCFAAANWIFFSSPGLVQYLLSNSLRVSRGIVDQPAMSIGIQIASADTAYLSAC
jgi:hypothetical protein